MPDKNGSNTSVWVLMRKNWWVIAVTVCVALAVAAWTVRDVQTTHMAAAEVTMRNDVVKREALMLPEEAVALAVDEDFAVAVADGSSLTADEYLKGAASYSTGPFREHIHLEFTSTDEEQAIHVAETMALELAEHARSSASEEIARAQDQIGLTEAMIVTVSELDPLTLASSAERGAYEIERRTYDLEIKLINYEDAEATLASAYTYNGSVEVVKTTAIEKAIRPLAGALLAGLALGVVLAWLKD